MKIKTKKRLNYTIGYRAKGIKVYKTKIKPLGYVVAGLGFVSITIAILPNGLGIIFYPLGFFLLGLVGIDIQPLEKKIKSKLKFTLWKLKR